MSISQANEIVREKGVFELLKQSFFLGYRKSISKPWKVVDPIDKRIGARAYGNPAGFITNLAGQAAEFKCRTLVNGGLDAASERTDYRARAGAFRQNGYLELGTPYDDGYVDEIQKRFDELIEDDAHTRVVHHNDPGNGENYIVGLKDVASSLPAASDLISPDIIRTLTAYYGSHLQVRNIRAYRTYHVPDEIMRETDVYNINWHCDGKTSDHVKLFVCLDDTTEADGPLHIMPKADTKRITHDRPDFDRYTDGRPNGFVDHEGSPVTLTGPAGTAMLGNTQTCLHRAGVPSEGRKRDLIQFYIAPSTKPLPDDWIEQELGGCTHLLFERLLKY